MKDIVLLDCTLRDGGYINNWMFGDKETKDIIEKLAIAKIDYIEVGFLRDEQNTVGRTIFSAIREVMDRLQIPIEILGRCCVMCEAMNPLPIDKIENYRTGQVGMIRVIIWKSLLEEGYKYCESIVKKGYKLCVQPNRVDQYTEDEFRKMIRKFNVLKPMAIYVVDSFGILNCEEIIQFVKIADEELEDNIKIGYHGHNNLQQANVTAESIIQLNLKHDLMLDCSIFGIGRCAGNLCTELIANYLNEKIGTNYNIQKFMEITDLYIQEIYELEKWGYLLCYYLTARHKCNPMYGFFYGVKNQLSSEKIDRILRRLSLEDKVIYTEKKAIEYAIKEGIRIENE